MASSSRQLREPMRIKILSMGSGGVGKSCLIKRYCEGRFVGKYISTIGVDYGVKTVPYDNYDLKVNFWDLSGHPEFFDVRNEFYRDTQGAMLVFDVSSRSSFADLEAWIREAEQYGAGDAQIIVVGNKVDLDRTVSAKEGKAWARAHGYEYFEASAKSGEGVDDIFEHLFESIASANQLT
ncbi:RJL family GTPase [Thecamonas trahens ATCC 50062]|uniref:RJL family GTPase n=1 Tax=Thecamonas trahens ATCC 50062 TaxID=461836 RepID=A0A0L0DIF1_THETB|nr:RJL family GTPase [Thecamonas trahens ATCC 50062]KNC52020.1 RJL family GTPase [Thecamonas trahens ATCC 50062]|eukprot:XP_013755603.1 RJL family GTPase [Thecamonas trahens ATCC 50062]